MKINKLPKALLTTEVNSNSNFKTTTIMFCTFGVLSIAKKTLLQVNLVLKRMSLMVILDLFIKKKLKDNSQSNHQPFLKLKLRIQKSKKLKISSIESFNKEVNGLTPTLVPMIPHFLNQEIQNQAIITNGKEPHKSTKM